MEKHEVFLTDSDCYIFGCGNHYEIYEKMGAHLAVKDGVEGYKFSVYNSGSTVPENEKDKIWSVLYKTDKSRTERDKSSGVGLAVSAKILDLHKADYGCTNVENGVKFYFNIKK